VYDAESEEAYRESQLKAFKKTIDEGHFPFIIVDNCNIRVSEFEPYWSVAKTKGFEVYVVEMTQRSIQVCHESNVHQRSLEDVERLAREYETTPGHYHRLTIHSLLQSDTISDVPEVEMTADDIVEEPEPTDVAQQQQTATEGDTEVGDTSPQDTEDPPVAETVNKEEVGGVAEGEEDEDVVMDEGADAMASLLGNYSKKKKRVRWLDLEEASNSPKDLKRQREDPPVEESPFVRKVKEEQREFARLCNLSKRMRGEDED